MKKTYKFIILLLALTVITINIFGDDRVIGGPGSFAASNAPTINMPIATPESTSTNN